MLTFCIVGMKEFAPLCFIGWMHTIKSSKTLLFVWCTVIQAHINLLIKKQSLVCRNIIFICIICCCVRKNIVLYHLKTPAEFYIVQWVDRYKCNVFWKCWYFYIELFAVSLLFYYYVCKYYYVTSVRLKESEATYELKKLKKKHPLLVH